MEIKKIKIQHEKEVYATTCQTCGMVVTGSTENQLTVNFARHKVGKECKRRTFEKRVQDALPPRTPGYSSKSKTTSEVQE